MEKSLKLRWLFIIGFVALCIWFFWPPEEKINLGLDLKGGTYMVLSVDVNGIDKKDIPVVVDGTVKVLKNRIDPEGIKEIEIRSHGNRIFIQIPKVKNISAIRERIQRTAVLEFCLVNENPDDLQRARNGEKIPGYRLAQYMKSDVDSEGSEERDILIKEKPELTGKYLKKATCVFGGNFNEPMVQVKFNKEGARRFALVTKTNLNKRLAIVLDGKVISAPVIRAVLRHGEGVIKGNMSVERAKELALLLNSGALPAPVHIISETTVSPTLGSDSIKKGVFAAILGLILVMIFMAVYYLISGLIADFALMLNLVILLGILAFFDATLTLPGIAGIILTIGMSVDANVLIFERIREEQKTGKKIKTAIAHGYNRAFRTILDANLTTLLTALILYWKGTGPIKGFGVTLSVGIVTSMFTALYVTRTVFDTITSFSKVEKLKMLQFFSNPKIPFLSYRKIAFLISLIAIIGGMIVFFARGKEKYGIDFTGGTIMQVKFSDAMDISELSSLLKNSGLEDSTIQNFGIDKKTFIIKSSLDDITKAEKFLKNSLDKKFKGRYKLIKTEQIGPAIGKELRISAIWAFVFAIVGILIYISWRFEFSFAVAAIIALIHDVLVTTGAIAISGYFSGREINLPVIAALLTIVGYSLNDTIVVFDRIREDLKLMKREKFENIINLSINQTLSRTILTSLTTLIVIICLYFFGGIVINGFAFTLLVGVIVGTYSSIFIASPILYEWNRRGIKIK